MPFLIDPPSAREDKPSFEKLPSAILDKIGSLLKTSVTGGACAYGGFSASASFILELGDGRKVFAKGNHPEEMAHGAENIRQEILAYRHIPVLQKISPAFLGMVSDGDEDGWMLGLWEYIPVSDEILSPEKIGDMIGAMVSWQEGPLPEADLKAAADKNYISFFLRDEKKWRRLAAEAPVREKFTAMFRSPEEAGVWLDRNLPALCALQSRVPQLKTKTGIVHGDLRVDNFLFSGNRVFVIDWPNACYGPVLLDLVFLFSNIESMGAATVEDMVGLYARKSGFDFSGEELAVMLAAVSGYFADQAYRSVPARLPRLRWMQKSMLLAQLRALSRLGHVDSLPGMQGESQKQA